MSFSVNVLINQKLLHFATEYFTLNHLYLCSQRIGSSQNIYEISITKDFVIITTEHAVPSESGTEKDSTAINKMLTNNIDAYDWDGNHMWNIADIVGDLKIPYFGGTVTTKQLLKRPDFDESKCDEQSDLYCCTAGNHMYIIDLSSLKLLQILETR